MSFFESFLGGAAQAGTGILQDQMKEEQVQRMAKFQEELAMERQRTINAMNQENAIAAEKRGIENRATERGQIRTEEIADEPRKRESKAADYKASEMAKYDPEIQALQRKAETEKLTATEQAQLDFYTKNKAGIIGQKRDMARAGHIDDGAGLRKIQMEAAQMALDEQKATAKMPQAVRDLAGSYRDQLKSLSATIDKGTLEGSATTEGLKALDSRRAELSQKLADTLRPYLGDKYEGQKPSAAPTNTWNNATGEVISNGQVIGKAKSPEEAKAMLAQSKSQPSPSAAPVTPMPSAPTQQFNEAGYVDVQSTIEGAKRGDQKALSLLRQLIDRGETSPAQRQQIAKITGQN